MAAHSRNTINMVAEHGASQIVDVFVPLIMEEIVEIVKVVLQERISERIREQIVDVHVPRAVEQVTEVPKIPSRDRILQRAADQILDAPVPEMVKQLVEVPKTVSQDRIQQRTVEQIVDVPVPQVVEELVEVSKVFPRDRVQQRFVEQTIETPAISPAVKIVEVPVIRTQEKTQQVVTTHVQHVVNTVEVEKPKIIKETAQRKKPIIQEKINQVTKHIEVPLVKFLDSDMPVVVQRQVSMTPEIQTVQGAQTSENLGTALARQLAQAETVEVVEIGALLPTKSASSMFVTTPVLEAMYNPLPL